MTSKPAGNVAAAAVELRGWQVPPIRCVAPAGRSSGEDVAELMAAVGKPLDEWQRLGMVDALGERADGKWAAFNVVMLCSRQNGKGVLDEARALGGLFLFGERKVLWSSHQFKTSGEGFTRTLKLIDGSDDLRRRVRKVSRSKGEEGITLRSGAELRFIARSNSSGRGFTGDCVILDEANILGDPPMQALIPTLSTIPNAQVWYTATAPNRLLAPCGPLSRLRTRALAGDNQDLTYLEWSAELCDEFCGAKCGEHLQPGDVRAWQRANPALGIRISLEYIAREYATLTAEGFAQERLSVGNYEADDAQTWQVIAEADWDRLIDPASVISGTMVLAADVTPDRTVASIAVAGRRADGLWHVEIIDHHPGTSWVPARVVQLVAKHTPCAVVVDPDSPAGSLLPDLHRLGVETTRPAARDVAAACGAFYDTVTDARALRHLDQPELRAALAGARKRVLGERWAWARKGTGTDISPLVAATYAMWGYATTAHLATAPFFAAAWR